ncbi:hypothetical protein [Sorangium sp. So ce233]|uniref:hypothetical protein n=1 Tax=Sorangium sp. So ce233 TaxID=3133290 RepID=UPI003F5FC348
MANVAPVDRSRASPEPSIPTHAMNTVAPGPGLRRELGVGASGASSSGGALVRRLDRTL